ncbi:quinolinate synthase [Ranunculus cassubicifolius]
MILSAAPKIHLPNNTNSLSTLTLSSPTKSLNTFHNSCKRNSSLANGTSQDHNYNKSLQNPNPRQIHHQVNHCAEDEHDENLLVPSASAVAAVIRKASTTSPVEFVQKIEKDGNIERPSSDFLKLCSEQLDLFRKIVDRDTVLSVYVRPAGSYVMDRLELHRVTFHPSSNVAETAEMVALIGTFGIPTGLRVAEIALSNLQAEVIHDCKAVVFPMVKHPFVVGFLVAEFPKMDFETSRNIGGNGQDLQLFTPQESYALPLHSERHRWDLKAFKEGQLEAFGRFTAEQKSSVINISRSLAVAYVMDQKAMLLQKSSWQNNIRMSDLVEQIRGSLSSIRSLSKMLSIHMKKSEISYDIIEDILVQGEQMRDTLQQLQDAVYLTKANIVQYNDDPVKRIKHSKTYVQPPEPGSSHLLDNLPSGIHADKTKQLSAIGRDLELPMPPLALAPLRQNNIRPSNVFDVLEELVGAAEPLAHKLERKVELNQISLSSSSSLVALEESALRQALSNLIEGALLRTHVSGKVEIVSTGAPAGGVLVVIDDDGPDMHYMTQMHSLTPFGPDLFSDGVIEDNMTWNFISGLTVAREILESYGCVLRVISPRAQDAVFGAGGTRIEIWFPSHTSNTDSTTNLET